MRYPNAKSWFVYRMRCLLEDVGDYIGITSRPFAREHEHKGKKKGYKLAAAIALFGEENFVYEIIDRCGTEDEARRLEKHYIKFFGTAWPDGLNVAACGQGSLKYLYDQRRKSQIAAWEDQSRRDRHSALLKDVMNEPDVRKRSSEAAKRRWADPAYRAKQSAAAAGRRHSEETKNLLRQQKLAASAAKGGPKGRPPKYPGISAPERGKLIYEAGREKRRQTWERNGDGNRAKARAQAQRINSDPELTAKRLRNLREWHNTNDRVSISDESRAKMSASQKARHEKLRANGAPFRHSEESKRKLSEAQKRHQEMRRLLQNPQGEA